MGRRLRTAAVAVAVLAPLGGSLSAARGDPVCVDAEVTREQESSIDPLGPPLCHWTPWSHMMTVENGDHVTGLNPGTPNGYEITVDLPAPEPP